MMAGVVAQFEAVAAHTLAGLAVQPVAVVVQPAVVAVQHVAAVV